VGDDRTTVAVPRGTWRRLHDQKEPDERLSDVIDDALDALEATA